MLTVLIVAGAHAADCPESTTNAQVASELQAALLSYAVMEEDAFSESADKAVLMVDCLGELATPQLAASLHRVRGVQLMLADDVDGATLSMAAARGLEPDHSLSATLAPEGGKLANAYAAAGAMAPLARAELGLDDFTIHIDGVASDSRPEGPYVIQVGGANPQFSTFVVSGAPVLPEGLEGSPPVASAPMPSPAPATRSSSTGSVENKKGKGLLWAGIVTGGVAAGLYGTAVAGRLSYDTTPSSSTSSLTNGAYLGSVGTAALSAGLLTTFLVTR